MDLDAGPLVDTLLVPQLMVRDPIRVPGLLARNNYAMGVGVASFCTCVDNSWRSEVQIIDFGVGRGPGKMWWICVFVLSGFRSSAQGIVVFELN